MNLLQHIRSDRKEKRKKEPYKQTLFNRIGAIVKSYSLDDGFLAKIETFTGELPGRDAELDRVNYPPRSGGLEFSAIGRKDKSTFVDYVELATGCEAPGLFARIKLKPQLEIPLFSLLTRDEYRVANKIIHSVENPNLHFANSPDEILLSGPLFLRNPSLPSETLAANHLETLLQCEFAKEKIRDLKQRQTTDPEKNIEGSPVEPARADPSPGRIEMLEAFVDGIEKNRTQL